MKLLAFLLVALSLPLRLVHAQASDAAPSMPELRRQLVQIDVTSATSVDDYLQRIGAVEEIMPKLDKAYEFGDHRLAENKKKYRNRPDLLRHIRAIEKLNSFDKQGLVLLKEEIKQAKWLSQLPPANQQQFFDEQILPIRKQMLEVAQKEVEFARQMKKQGLALPPDVSESIR